MANADTTLGFLPVNRGGQATSGAVKYFYVAASDTTPLYVGDPVVKTANGANSTAILNFPIGTLPEITRAGTSTTTSPITGIVVGVLNQKNISENVTYSAGSVARVIEVNTDILQEYAIEVNAAPTSSMTQVGLNANWVAGTADSIFGGSGARLALSTADTTSTLQFKIQRFENIVNNDATLTAATAIVTINNSTEAVNTAGV
jgi:hypothetical protein